jgi:hypothetical protein
VRTILQSLGEELAYFAVPRPGSPGMPRYTILLAVKDATQMRQAISSLLTLAQGNVEIQANEFLGHTIRTVKPVLPGVPQDAQKPEFSWVLTDDFLVMSASSEALKEVLQFKAGKRRDSLARTKTYSQARALLPEKLAAIEFTDVGTIGEIYVRQLNAASAQPALRSMLGQLFDFTVSLPPSTVLENFGLAASGLVVDNTGLSALSVLSGPQK